MEVNAESKKSIYVLVLIIIVFAAAYFSPTCTHFLNPEDEGYLLYNFERVARGELPHRDFYDIYGALTYFLGGALFKLFGIKILVIRIFVVTLLAAIAILIFFVGCRLAPPVFAFLGSTLFVIYWGDPLFPAALYGNHCAHFLALLGILFMLSYLDDGKKRWVVAAGFCAGMGVLFKLPTGLFTLMAFGLFLSFKEQFPDFAGSGGEGNSARALRLVKTSRLLKAAIIVGTAIVFTLYFSTFYLDPYHVVIFLLSLFLLLGLIFVREASIFNGVNQENALARWAKFKRFIGELLLISVGPVSLFLLQVLFYWQVGGLDEMLYDTFALPPAIDYYWPMDAPRLHAAMIIAAAILVALMVLWGRSPAGESRIAKGIFFAVALALLLGPTIFVFVRNVLPLMWRARVAHVLTTFVLFVTFPFLAAHQEDKPGEARHKLALSLCYVFSSLFFIMSFPRTDVSHIVHASTVVFIVVAFVLWKLNEGGRRVFGKGDRVRSATWVAAGFLIVALPFLWNLRIYRIWDFFESKNPRAQGLNIHQTEGYLNIYGVVEFLRANTAPDERIFVISEHQVIYFLAGRDTILPKKNYFTYLSNLSFINSGSDVRLTDRELVETLVEMKPRFVIEERDDWETRAFMETWPNTAAYIGSAYQPVIESETLQILQLRAAGTPREKSL